jgi:hypothetical protein
MNPTAFQIGYTTTITTEWVKKTAD